MAYLIPSVAFMIIMLAKFSLALEGSRWNGNSNFDWAAWERDVDERLKNPGRDRVWTSWDSQKSDFDEGWQNDTT